MDKKCAFFSIADNYHYVPMVITALCSIRRFHQNQDYFVLGRFKHDKKALSLLEQHNIECIHLDLSQVFDKITIVLPDISESRTWPSEVNWWPYVHTLLLKRDYPYSCYVDGDMLCVGDLEINTVLKDTKHISAVSKPNCLHSNIKLFFVSSRVTETNTSIKRSVNKVIKKSWVNIEK